MSLKSLNIDKTWTLFLDRDGVINRKIENDYVRNINQFELIPGVIDGLRILRGIFGKIIILTNQRCIGRGLMKEEDLLEIHAEMLKIFNEHGISIDGIYYCPHDPEKEECNCRKPKPGLALKAKEDFSSIDFKRSIMVGDSLSDMELGRNLGMITIFISPVCYNSHLVDYQFENLWEFAIALQNKI